MERKGLVLLQQVLRELQTEHRGLFRQLAQPFFSGSIEQGPAPHKTIVAVVEQHFLLWCQLPMMTVHILDAFKEFLIETDIIRMFGQDGTHLLGQGIHLVVGLSREQVEEDGCHPTEQVVVVIALFLVVHTDDGIVESGFLGIVDDLLDLFIIPTDALQHRLLEILQTDTVEGRHIMGRIIRQKKRILSLLLLVHN